jgi:PTH1 family peptidyl-tRNA hydrolase
MENWHLVVGLGNPGADYDSTRHNAGFLLVEHLAKSWQGIWRSNKRLVSRLARAERDGKRLILCQPQTYMNLSGEAVGAVRDFYRVPLGQVLIVVDDADLPLGEIRLRPGGSSGGHHGLESVERRLGTRQYARLRLGIGRRLDAGREIKDYVLSRFTAEEAALFQKVLQRAGEQVECWLRAGIEKAMAQFNGLIKDRES